MSALPVSLDDVKRAASRIKGRIVGTPLLQAPLLDKELGFRLLIKAENLQLTGAFKARGAFNQILQLTPEEKKKGVIAISAGNHSQAVALAAVNEGIEVTIAMPADAPRLKMENTKRYGATVITYDRVKEDREEIGRRLAAERGARMVHPYNDPRTIAGQGTAGLEIYEQTGELGLEPDAILVSCSGGGLSSGIALTRALYGRKPDIYTVEPENFDDMKRSLEAGHAVPNKRPGNGSICDALMAMVPGEYPLAILLDEKAQGFAIPDACTEAAMSVAADYYKLVAEPGGAVALAAACLNRARFQRKTVVAVVSGGNVDPAKYLDMLRRGYDNRKLLFS